jgi:CelD/BcsL family acetyltransferase involved in cellulose biosynthesis
VSLRDINPEDITSIRVPATTERIDGSDVEVIHEGGEQTAADALWEALQNDTMDQWIADNPEWVKQTGNSTSTATAGEEPSETTD